jgi:hypothetical protein
MAAFDRRFGGRHGIFTVGKGPNGGEKNKSARGLPRDLKQDEQDGQDERVNSQMRCSGINSSSPSARPSWNPANPAYPVRTGALSCARNAFDTPAELNIFRAPNGLRFRAPARKIPARPERGPGGPLPFVQFPTRDYDRKKLLNARMQESRIVFAEKALNSIAFLRPGVFALNPRGRRHFQ